jgi:hypothetical protein
MSVHVHVVKLEPTSQWDQTVLNLLWTNELSPTGLNFVVHDNEYPNADGIVLVIPGRFWSGRDPERFAPETITREIARYRWVLAIRTGDEEDWFHPGMIQHPNIRWWIQTPRMNVDYGYVRRFGVGFTPHLASLSLGTPDKDIDLYLSAQNTHPRRFDAFRELHHLQWSTAAGLLIISNESPGFTQGVPPEMYAFDMVHTKIALCPAGPDTPDTFRLYEALEAHCIPIADDVCANRPEETGYWRSLFPDAPFPILADWEDLPLLVGENLPDWVAKSNRITAWWILQKREYVRWLHDDLHVLAAGVDAAPQQITAVVPVSPIPSHPDISIIRETVNSIRYWLPDCEIILTFDGVRPEQEHMREAYEESIRRVLWEADRTRSHITPIIFDEHMHQSGMLRAMINQVHTPMLMYVEADCPLVTDWPIPWEDITRMITSGVADVVRLHHEALILPVHEHLMMQRQGDFWRTKQWSQRPHVASTSYYHDTITQRFSENTKCFLEERMAGQMEHNPDTAKVFIYAPEDGSNNIKRSWTLDGRGDAPQFLESQVF